jgi:hypothetical protein
LRVFGCTAYAHVDNGKLEPRAVKCVFLGYKSGVKGYKLWNLETRKVLISRNVIFNESAMLHDSPIDVPVENQQKSSVQVEQFIDAQQKVIDSVPVEPIVEDTSTTDVPIVS